jgi:dihydrofolate reductase
MAVFSRASIRASAHFGTGRPAPLASTAVVTEIDADFEGDAFAPELGATWQEIERESHVGANGLPFSFVTYQHPR